MPESPGALHHVIRGRLSSRSFRFRNRKNERDSLLLSRTTRQKSFGTRSGSRTSSFWSCFAWKVFAFGGWRVVLGLGAGRERSCPFRGCMPSSPVQFGTRAGAFCGAQAVLAKKRFKHDALKAIFAQKVEKHQKVTKGPVFLCPFEKITKTSAQKGSR